MANGWVRKKKILGSEKKITVLSYPRFVIFDAQSTFLEIRRSTSPDNSVLHKALACPQLIR